MKNESPLNHESMNAELFRNLTGTGSTGADSQEKGTKMLSNNELTKEAEAVVLLVAKNQITYRESQMINELVQTWLTTKSASDETKMISFIEGAISIMDFETAKMLFEPKSDTMEMEQATN